MKETSSSCIYLKNDVCKGDVFLRKKIQMIGLLALLICAVLGSHRAGEYLYSHYVKDPGQETAAKTKDKTENKTYKVIIDCGHGGADPGKVGINQALEKDINLSIGKKVKALLEPHDVQIVMTREDEGRTGQSQVEDIKNRVELINEEKPDLAVSIHQNSYPGESIHGAQVFYHTQSKAGKVAAETMQKTLLQIDAENKRQAKGNDTYYLLKKTKVPLIIVECGFLSNQEEAGKLVTEEYQEKVAQAVCDGVLQYLTEKE